MPNKVFFSDENDRGDNVEEDAVRGPVDYVR